MGFKIEVTLEATTCPCGTVYAVPYWLVAGQFSCPTCSYRKYAELLRRFYESDNKNVHLNRVIVGLRGALGRKKK